MMIRKCVWVFGGGTLLCGSNTPLWCWSDLVRDPVVNGVPLLGYDSHYIWSTEGQKEKFRNAPISSSNVVAHCILLVAVEHLRNSVLSVIWVNSLRSPSNTPPSIYPWLLSSYTGENIQQTTTKKKAICKLKDKIIFHSRWLESRPPLNKWQYFTKGGKHFTRRWNPLKDRANRWSVLVYHQLCCSFRSPSQPGSVADSPIVPEATD